MLIQCTACKAKFSLPNTYAKNNALLRCSLCKTVFPIEEGLLTESGELLPPLEREAYLESLVCTTMLTEMDTPTSQEESPPKDITFEELSKNKPNAKRFFFVLLLVLVLALGAIVYYSKYFSTNKQTKNTPLTLPTANLSIQNLRQYYVQNNKKVGTIFVIEGVVQNNTEKAQALVTLSSTLVDKQGAIVAQKEQLAGIVLSSFQLQTLSQDELEAMLNDTVEIAATNGNIPPKKTVPFTVLYFNPPKNVAEFTIQITSARPAE